MRLAELIEQLRDNQAAIAKLENALAQYPSETSLTVNINAHRKLQRELEAKFAEATSASFIDVCSYRLFSESGVQPLLPAVTNALSRFQTLFTLVYDVQTNNLNRLKQSSHVSANAVAATTFGYGYSFAGSVGFVLTLRNDRMLVDESNLDRAMRTLFELAKANSSEQIAEYAKVLGPAVIRTTYSWVSGLVSNGVGADIDWRRHDEVRASLFVQLPELENLERAIKETSDEIVDEFTWSGRLIGADFKAHNFHMLLDEGPEIRGALSKDIARVEIPGHYVVTIRQTTKTNYATEKDEVSYFLVALKVTPS